MKSYCFALATLAAIGLSGTAFAGEATTASKATTTTKQTSTAAQLMSDSDMDKVTAGRGISATGAAMRLHACGHAASHVPFSCP
jgi:hypothetical protein